MADPVIITVADPGFPIGGHRPRGGRQLPRRLHFEKFVCQNERIWTLRGRTPVAPLDPPMHYHPTLMKCGSFIIVSERFLHNMV